MAGERITTTQVMMLVAFSRFTLTLVYFPATANPELKQDPWLASLLGALLGIPFAWMLNRLWQRFPDQTFVQVAEAVLGKALGKALVLLHLLFLLLAFSLELRLAGEFFVFAFLPRTPIIVVIGVVAGLAAWAAKAGVEVIGRAGQVVFPMLVGTILLIFLMLLKDIQFSNLTPVFIQSGPVANFKEMFNVVARNIEFVWLGMMAPFVNERCKLFRSVALALVCQGLIWVVMGVAVTGILGLDAQRLYFPFYGATRHVSIADFLERVDAILLAAWLLGMFLRGALILWAGALGTAQWLGLKEYRPLVIPLTGIAMTYSIAQAETFSELRGYLRPETFTPYMLTFVWVIPVLVLAVAAIRGLQGTQAAAAAGGSPRRRWRGRRGGQV